MDSQILSLASRFATFYGLNGSLMSQNVTLFLSNLHMDRIYIRRLKSQGECPRHNFSSDAWYNHGRENLTELILAVWDTVQTPDCHTNGGLLSKESRDGSHEPSGGSPAEVWGYGLLFVTIINLCSALGIIFLPFMGRRIYKLMMTFMTSLAVGSLLATALLILLPDSLQLSYIHEELNSENSVLSRFNLGGRAGSGWEQFLSDHPWYIWRSCSVFGGVYLFFGLERLLKELLGWKGRDSHHNHDHVNAGASNVANEATAHQSYDSDPAIGLTLVLQDDSAGVKLSAGQPEDPVGERDQPELAEQAGLKARLARVKPVAWMILIGDGLHNFIDGLSLGAAFSRSTLTGVSISLAVLCEELPHELGDFAILLSAGMSVPMAVTTNLMSAGVCYLGFALGVFLGEVVGVSVWIFAFGAGMFLYISLVDMMPEVNHAMDSHAAKDIGKRWIFLVQNVGFILGYGLILVIALFGGDIKIGG